MHPSSFPMSKFSLLLAGIQESLHSALENTSQIPTKRRQALNKISEFINHQLATNSDAHLLFVCTHNSRRSQMAQLWAVVAAFYYGLDDKVESWSGGTEVTAFNPRALAAMERAGFEISNPGGDNPHYHIRFLKNGPEILCFSKLYSDSFNPKDHMAAIMTCTEADQTCPFVEGAIARIPLPYLDPKEADGTTEENHVYDERCMQIATEMMFVFSQI